MRSHAADITPKLRSVLFLVDGVQPVQKILERAGELRPLLESQLAELLRLGLAQPAGAAGRLATTRDANANVNATTFNPAPSRDAESAGVPPLVGAKMQLLKQLEILDGHVLRQYSPWLVEAHSWRELASRSKDLARTLQDVAGADASLAFWISAKEILVSWREKEIEISQVRP